MTVRSLILILILSLVTACGANPPATPTLQPATLEPKITETSIPTRELSQGELLFRQFNATAGFACATCHYPNSDDRLLGPGLLHVEDRFKTYDIDVDTVEDYIKQSIKNPAAFIVPDESPYPSNIMPRNYSEIFTEDQLDELVAFILSS